MDISLNKTVGGEASGKSNLPLRVSVSCKSLGYNPLPAWSCNVLWIFWNYMNLLTQMLTLNVMYSYKVVS